MWRTMKSSSFENKKIIESLYKKCIEEKPLANIGKNFKNEEKDPLKKFI